MTTFASEVASPPVPDWYHPALDNILTMQFDDGTTVTNCLTGLTGETFDVANQIGTTAPNGERLSMTWSVAPSQELLDSVNADPFSTLETEQERLDNYHLVIPYPRSTEELIITPTTNVSKDFVIEFKLKYETIASGNPSILVAGSSTSSQYHIYLNNTSITLGYQWQITKFTLANTLPITKSDAPVTIRLVLKDGNLSAYQDGVQLALLSGSETGITKGFLIEDTQLFTRNNEGLSLFYFTYASNDFPADSRYWNFDKTFGAVINDEFNNQPLTLVGFPAASGSVRAFGVSDGLEFNGVDTYATIPVITLGAGDTITLEHTVDSGSSGNDYLLDGDDAIDRPYLYLTANGTIYFNTNKMTVELDGVAVTPAVTVYPKDNKFHTIKCSITATCKLATIGARYTFVDHTKGVFKSLEVVSATNPRYYDFTKITNNTIVPETLGGQDGTLVGFTDVYIPEKTKTLIGQEFKAAADQLLLSLTGAWTGNIINIDGTITPISGSGDYTLDGTTPIKVATINITDTVSTYNLDFTQDTGDTIIDTSGNDNHGTVVGGELRRVYDYTGYGEIVGFRFNGITVASLNSDIVLSDFSITISGLRISASTAVTEYQAITGSRAAYTNFIAVTDSAWHIRINNSNYTIPFTTVKEPLAVGMLTVTRAGNQLTLTFDGDSATITVTTGSFLLGCFGTINAAGIVESHTFEGDIGGLALDSSNNYDFTTGDNSRIIDTVGGKHATVVNVETSGFIPIIEKYVFIANANGTQDYTDIASFATARKGNDARIDELQLQGDFVGKQDLGYTLVGNFIIRGHTASNGGENFEQQNKLIAQSGIDYTFLLTTATSGSLHLLDLALDCRALTSDERAIYIANSDNFNVLVDGVYSKVPSGNTEHFLHYFRNNSTDKSKFIVKNSYFDADGKTVGFYNLYRNTNDATYINVIARGGSTNHSVQGDFTNCVLLGNKFDALATGSNNFHEDATTALATQLDFTGAFNPDGTIDPTWYAANLEGNGWNGTNPVEWAVNIPTIGATELTVTMDTSFDLYGSLIAQRVTSFDLFNAIPPVNQSTSFDLYSSLVQNATTSFALYGSLVDVTPTTFSLYKSAIGAVGTSFDLYGSHTSIMGVSFELLASGYSSLTVTLDTLFDLYNEKAETSPVSFKLYEGKVTTLITAFNLYNSVTELLDTSFDLYNASTQNISTLFSLYNSQVVNISTAFKLYEEATEFRITSFDHYNAHTGYSDVRFNLGDILERVVIKEIDLLGNKTKTITLIDNKIKTIALVDRVFNININL